MGERVSITKQLYMLDGFLNNEAELYAKYIDVEDGSLFHEFCVDFNRVFHVKSDFYCCLMDDNYIRFFKKGIEKFGCSEDDSPEKQILKKIAGTDEEFGRLTPFDCRDLSIRKRMEMLQDAGLMCDEPKKGFVVSTNPDSIKNKDRKSVAYRTTKGENGVVYCAQDLESRDTSFRGLIHSLYSASLIVDKIEVNDPQANFHSDDRNIAYLTNLTMRRCTGVSEVLRSTGQLIILNLLKSDPTLTPNERDFYHRTIALIETDRYKEDCRKDKDKPKNGTFLGKTRSFFKGLVDIIKS